MLYIFHYTFSEDGKRLEYIAQAGPLKGFVEKIEIQIHSISPGIFAISWQEMNKTTVTHIGDFVNGRAHSNITLPNGQFCRLKGTIKLLG